MITIIFSSLPRYIFSGNAEKLDCEKHPTSHNQDFPYRHNPHARSSIKEIFCNSGSGTTSQPGPCIIDNASI